MGTTIDRLERKPRRARAGEAGGRSHPDGMPFGMAISILMTAAFNASRGSLLIAVLFHFQINNPIWPDALPWAALTFSVAAIVVVWLNRTAMLSRSGAATRILMEPAQALPRSTASA